MVRDLRGERLKVRIETKKIHGNTLNVAGLGDELSSILSWKMARVVPAKRTVFRWQVVELQPMVHNVG